MTSSGRAPPAFFKRFGQIGLGKLEGRGKTENDSGQDGNHHGEPEHLWVQTDPTFMGKSGWNQERHQVKGAVSEEQAKRAAEESEDSSFGEELPDQPRAPRA